MASNYAFIDSQNLNLGIQSLGWKMDWKKLRQYLRNKYQVTNAYLFIGYVPGNGSLYKYLQNAGFVVVFKTTMMLPDGTVKGNVDAELVLHTMIEYPNYDKAIILSGDGDFYCLVEFLNDKGKLLHIMTPNKHYSRLYKKYSSLIVGMDQLKNSLELKTTGISGRSKP